MPLVPPIHPFLSEGKGPLPDLLPPGTHRQEPVLRPLAQSTGVEDLLKQAICVWGGGHRGSAYKSFSCQLWATLSLCSRMKYAVKAPGKHKFLSVTPRRNATSLPAAARE